MRTLVFSDTHLSNRVYRRKLAYLQSIIELADNVIILGDLWDGFLTDFDGFLDSGWQALFPLLLERQAVYIFGNHDRIEWNDERASWFSVEQCLALERTIGGQPYYFTHGHEGTFLALDDRYPVLKRSIPLRLGSSIDILHKIVWGRPFLAEGNDINQPMRDWVKDQLPPPTIMVAGHSHYPEIDYQHRIMNPGFIGCGFGNYLLLSDDGAELVKERYWRKSWEL